MFPFRNIEGVRSERLETTSANNGLYLTRCWQESAGNCAYTKVDRNTIRALEQRFVIEQGNSPGVAHSLPVAPNLVARDFSPALPNQVWTTDITYLATDEGWLYLTVMLDLFSRQVVGWSIQPRMTQQLVVDALRMAWFRRRPAEGLCDSCW